MNTRIAVKENFDDDDLSDDVDDEVFVRDGTKSILKTEKHQKGDERPLMPPRRKSKQRQRTSNPDVCNRQPCNIYNCLLPVYFAIATIISIACKHHQFSIAMGSYGMAGKLGMGDF